MKLRQLLLQVKLNTSIICVGFLSVSTLYANPQASFVNPCTQYASYAKAKGYQTCVGIDNESNHSIMFNVSYSDSAVVPPGLDVPVYSKNIYTSTLVSVPDNFNPKLKPTNISNQGAVGCTNAGCIVFG